MDIPPDISAANSAVGEKRDEIYPWDSISNHESATSNKSSG